MDVNVLHSINNVSIFLLFITLSIPSMQSFFLVSPAWWMGVPSFTVPFGKALLPRRHTRLHGAGKRKWEITYFSTNPTSECHFSRALIGQKKVTIYPLSLFSKNAGNRTKCPRFFELIQMRINSFESDIHLLGLYCGSVKYISLAYTKPVNSVFRALWLVPYLGIS